MFVGEDDDEGGEASDARTQQVQPQCQPPVEDVEHDKGHGVGVQLGTISDNNNNRGGGVQLGTISDNNNNI